MSDLVRYEINDRVAVLTIDNPPVNALSPDVWDGIDQAVARADGDPAADAIVLIGAGTTFIAGADIKVFDTLKTAEASFSRSASTHALLRRMEDAGKPLVAAYSWQRPRRRPRGRAGVSLPRRDEGREGRTARKSCSASFRAPAARSDFRACAARRWRSRCAPTAKPCPRRRRSTPASSITSSTGGLLEGAIAFAKSKVVAHDIRKTREIAMSLADAERRPRGVRGDAADAGEDRARARRRRSPWSTPSKPDCATTSTRDRDASARSSRECVVSTESKALRHLFFAEREVAKVPDIPKETPDSRDQARRRRRRRHHGRRHRDDLRQRRDSGAAERGGRSGAPARAGDDSQELRRDDVEGQDDRRTGRQDHGAHHAHDDLRRLRSGGHRRRGGVREHGPEEGHVRRTGTRHAPGLRAGVEFLDARHRRVRPRERPPGAGDRTPLLQPGQRDAASSRSCADARRARR